MFVDIASPGVGTYESPLGTIVLISGYCQHDSFSGFTCCLLFLLD